MPALPAGEITPKPLSLAQAERPFSLASSFPPIPAKLVKRIHQLEFVEMCDLLPDNLALAKRLEALPLRLTQLGRPAEQKEVHSILTWVSCFATYMAIISQAHPERMIDMLAYMRLLIREANKHGGNGRLTYDMVFRRNRQERNDQWDVLDPSLHTAYIAGQGLSNRVPCKFCNEVDHFASNCALSPITVESSPGKGHIAR